MSNARFSIIPAWIVTDSRLKGCDLKVLCLLGSFTNKEGWCRRSQVKMAAELGCGRSTVQDALNRLYQIGVVEKREIGSADGRDSAHFYRVILDRNVSDALMAAWDEEEEPEEFHPISRENGGTPPAGIPAPPAGIPAPPAGPEPAPPAGPEPAPINDTSLTISSNESERARARDIGDEEEKADDKAIRRDYQRMVNGWPGFAGLSLKSGEREFFKLTPNDRATAVRMKDHWLALLRKQGKDHTPAPSTYLAERLWEAVPDPAQATHADRTSAPPFGKAWVNRLLKELEADPIDPPPPAGFIKRLIDQGGTAGRRAQLERQARFGWPVVNDMLQRASEGKGVLVSAEEARSLPDMKAVEAGSTEFHAWRVAFEERGWPWIHPPRAIAYVWFPATGPEGLATGPPRARAESG